MKLHIDFNNNTPSVDFATKGAEAFSLPLLELQVKGGGRNSKEQALTQYLQQFDYVFRCVNNTVNPAIKEIVVEDVWFLNQIKKTIVTSFGQGTKEDEDLKYDIVLYDLAAGNIAEKLYLTRNGTPIEKLHNKNSSVFADDYGNIINSNILQRDQNDGATINTLKVIALVEKYLPNYKLKWDNYTKSLKMYNREGVPIVYSQIKRESIYTFFKMFSLLLSRGKHTGVFYLNCMNFTTEELQALLGLIDLVFAKTAVIFLYNCDSIDYVKVKREVIELPNFIINK